MDNNEEPNTETQTLEPIDQAKQTPPGLGLPPADDPSLHPPAENLNILTPHEPEPHGAPNTTPTPLVPMNSMSAPSVGNPGAVAAPSPHPVGQPNPNAAPPITNNHLSANPQPTPLAAGEHLTVTTSSGMLQTPAGVAAASAPHWYQKFWHVIQGLPTDITSMLTIFDRLGPKFRATTVLILKDVMTVAVDASQDAAAIGSKNAAGVVSLSEATVAAIRQLIADALAGEADVVADFKQLGIHIVDGELTVDQAATQTLTAAASSVAVGNVPSTAAVA